MKKLLNTLTKFNPASVKVARYYCLFSVLHSSDLYKNYNNSHKDRLILRFTGSPIVNENEISVIFINNDSRIQQYNTTLASATAVPMTCIAVVYLLFSILENASAPFSFTPCPSQLSTNRLVMATTTTTGTATATATVLLLLLATTSYYF